MDQRAWVWKFRSQNGPRRARSLEQVGIHAKPIMGDDDKDVDLVVPEHSPVGESKSNGAVENASKRVQGQMRTLRLAIEESTGRNIDIDLNIWQWLAECAADTCNRHKVGHDGLTAYKRAK